MINPRTKQNDHVIISLVNPYREGVQDEGDSTMHKEVPK
jgi:hypothetical protein